MSNSTRFIPPNTMALDDVNAEQVRRIHDAKIIEIQKAPVLAAQVISEVVLADAVDTAIPHSLGRAPIMVWVSPVRGSGFVAGGIRERTTYGSGEPIDRTRYIVLQAFSYTTSITVDVAVF